MIFIIKLIKFAANWRKMDKKIFILFKNKFRIEKIELLKLAAIVRILINTYGIMEYIFTISNKNKHDIY